MMAAWSLTTKLAHRIFADLQVARSGACLSVFLTTICAHLLWRVFTTHDITMEYGRSKFEIVKKMLASNSGIVNAVENHEYFFQRS